MEEEEGEEEESGGGDMRLKMVWRDSEPMSARP